MHDKNGNELQVGDRVTVLATVTALTHQRANQATGGDPDEYANLTLETVEPMPPGRNCSTLVLNSKQTERVQTKAEADAKAATEREAGRGEGKQPPTPPAPDRVQR